jgi:hypothetical protein
MKPNLICVGGLWFCIGGASVGYGETIKRAYGAWYMNRIFS